MTQDAFYQAIGLSQEAQEAIANYSLNPDTYAQQRQLFLHHRQEFLQQFEDSASVTGSADVTGSATQDNSEAPMAGANSPRPSHLAPIDNPPLFFLSFASQYAQESLPHYVADGIPQKVCLDTFRNITLWQADHYKQTGTMGITRLPWMCKVLDMKVFRLGRLTFEPTVAEPELAEVTNPLFPAPGDPVIHTHIPADGPLSVAACQDSYQQALRFFATAPHNKTPHSTMVATLQTAPFVCHSWLLSPALKKLLPPESNIIKFQQNYTVKVINTTRRQAELRIFGELQDDPLCHPAHTTLQKAAREWLIAGKTIPLGYGVRTA